LHLAFTDLGMILWHNLVITWKVVCSNHRAYLHAAYLFTCMSCTKVTVRRPVNQKISAAHERQVHHVRAQIFSQFFFHRRAPAEIMVCKETLVLQDLSDAVAGRDLVEMRALLDPTASP
jgi:hypothetical protein